jgi:transposase
VGLAPAEYSTGGRQRMGHISNQGNVFLRWVLVEAATVATRYSPEMKHLYWRLVERRGKAGTKHRKNPALSARLQRTVVDAVSRVKINATKRRP